MFVFILKDLTVIYLGLGSSGTRSGKWKLIQFFI